MSENGWIEQELFFYWLKDLFLKYIPPERPVMLVMDGHSSHYTPEAIRGAAQMGVIVLCIPPNTTHATQPLDVSLFGPLKRHWVISVPCILDKESWVCSYKASVQFVVLTSLV